jgi:hypothetical protein
MQARLCLPRRAVGLEWDGAGRRYRVVDASSVYNPLSA